MHEGGAPMTWMDGMSAAVAFMESHLDETIAPEEIAAQAGFRRSTSSGRFPCCAG
jgi:hypothetical protein